MAGLRRERARRGCYRGATANDGRHDGAGTYARKHEPAISFTAISGSADPLREHPTAGRLRPGRVGVRVDRAEHVPRRPRLSDRRPRTPGCRTFVPRILDSPAWSDGGVLFITFDEADSARAGREPRRDAGHRPERHAAGTRSSMPAHPLLAAPDDPGRPRRRLPGRELPGEHARRVLPLEPVGSAWRSPGPPCHVRYSCEDTRPVRWSHRLEAGASSDPTER